MKTQLKLMNFDLAGEELDRSLPHSRHIVVIQPCKLGCKNMFLAEQMMMPKHNRVDVDVQLV